MQAPRPALARTAALFPRPPALEPAIRFWTRVYTQIDTNAGYLHDEYDLSVIYTTLHFAPNTSRRERERIIEAARDRYVAALERIAAGTRPLSPEDERIRELWGAEGTPVRLLEATHHIRFQLGQSDRFRAGLERSGRWEQQIKETLERFGLPPQLAVLPHVESSFNPQARSKDGAAGMWQFMRLTGRRYMRVNSTEDDRFDPLISTEAAAELLSYDYRLLGTWPLAITAYNHGAAGMRRAVETLGTTSIATIVREYQSPTFGFASRNFYASFLAALDIDRDPQKYFGPVERDPEMRFQEVRLPFRASLPALERALDVGRDRLRALNPALRPICWRGRRLVPRGYRLRLPLGGPHWTATLLAERLRSSRAPETLLARRDAAGDRAAEASGTAQATRASGTAQASRAASGPAASGPAASGPAALGPAALGPAALGPGGAGLLASSGAAVQVARIEREAESVTSASITAPGPAALQDSLLGKPPESLEPVTAAEAEALGPALGPAAAESVGAADPIDYTVARNGTIVVAAAETLGHYADWLDIPTWRLRRLNHMRYGRPVVMGHRIKLVFGKVSREAFEAKRLAYHRSLEASYFAVHHIVGTQIYTARRGDSLWRLTQHYAHLPIWLLEQYNPDLDFSDMRPGTRIVVPRVEDESAQKG